MSSNTELLAALRLAYPQLFSTRKEAGVLREVLDLEKIRVLAGEGNYRDRYGLRWENRPEKFEADSVGKLPTLKGVAGRRVQKDPSKPTHVLIEGDNYHALQVLAYTHERSVDVIYIDPPYNTGNKDFKYNDRFDDRDAFVDREDSYRHSKWLSFMAKRLALAKTLLKDTGLLFISIDDNEQAPLRLLCDEIFGEGNLVAQLIWKCRAGGGANTKKVSVDHEYVLMYAKLAARVPELSIPFSDEQLKKFSLVDSRGQYYLKSLERPEGLPGERPNLQYAITAPDGSSIVEKRVGTKYTWVVGLPKFMELLKDDRVVFKRGKRGWHPYRKLYLSETDTAGQRETRPRSALVDIALTREGSAELANVLGENVQFLFPKPSRLIEHLLAIARNAAGTDALILDFFAGSGTTAHAIMQLNAKDGGRRQCILVTNDEGEFKDDAGNILAGGICTHVTYPRLKKVIEGYTTPKGKAVDGLGENLEFFRTSFHSVPKTKGQTQAFARACVPLLELKAGCFRLTEETDAWRVYETNGKHLFVLLDDMAGEEAFERLSLIEGPVEAYIFAYEPDDDTAELLSVLPNVTVQEVPKPILDLFHRHQEPV